MPKNEVRHTMFMGPHMALYEAQFNPNFEIHNVFDVNSKLMTVI